MAHRGASRPIAAALLVALAGAASSSQAAEPPAGIREACRQFVAQALPDPGSADYGDYTAWTVIANADGSYSVGAKYRAKNSAGVMRQRYTVCIIQHRGKDFRLEKLSQMVN